MEMHSKAHSGAARTLKKCLALVQLPVFMVGSGAWILMVILLDMRNGMRSNDNPAPTSKAEVIPFPVRCKRSVADKAEDLRAIEKHIEDAWQIATSAVSPVGSSRPQYL